MDKVYIAYDDSIYDSYVIKSVFSTEDLAKEYISIHQECSYDCFDVDVIDKHVQMSRDGYKKTRVEIYPDGNKKIYQENFLYFEKNKIKFKKTRKDNLFGDFENHIFIYDYYVRNKEDAYELAKQKREVFLTENEEELKRPSNYTFLF